MELLIAALAGASLAAVGVAAYGKWKANSTVRLLRSTINNINDLAAGGDEDAILAAKQKALEIEDLTARLKDAAKGLKA